MLKALQQSLQKASCPTTKRWFENYLKNVISYRGVKTPEVSRLVARWYTEKNLAHFALPIQLTLASTLLQQKYAEDKFAGILYLEKYLLHQVPATMLLDEFKYNRKLCDILFKSAWKSVEENLSLDSGIPALVLTLQTAGEALNWNPHLHGMIADGVFSDDGTFTQFTEINLKAIEDRFA